MSTTWSMWLGITFTGLAVVATILQAWLWSFPMVPDPGGPDPNGRSTAPRLWTNIHRLLGAAYVVIYLVLMVEMVPRLWEYQVELPARTVVHACMGILIGVLLATKVAIIRWFQHFGKALPSIGLGLLTCTLLLATLSIPFALRAHDFGEALSADNVARVKRVLASVPWEQEVDLDRLVSEDSFETGVDVLTGKCVRCHDIRTILYKPRTAEGWHNVVVRMAKKPLIGDRIHDHEIPKVTAYLVAITPDIQESFQLKKQHDTSHDQVTEAVKEAAPAPAAVVSEEAGQALLNLKCTDCHELDEVDGHGKDTREGWTKVVNTMVEEHGAELTPEEAANLIAYLATSPKYGK